MRVLLVFGKFPRLRELHRFNCHRSRLYLQGSSGIHKHWCSSCLQIVASSSISAGCTVLKIKCFVSVGVSEPQIIVTGICSNLGWVILISTLCVCVCVCVRVRARMRACVRVCAWVLVSSCWAAESASAKASYLLANPAWITFTVPSAEATPILVLIVL